MAAIRQVNWLGQVRVDVRDLRAMESAMAYDWDVFAGQMFAGERPTVLYGMSVLTTGAIGAPATSLRVNVADALLLHYGGTDNGTLYKAPSDRTPETLAPGNARLTGAWSSGVTNYVGIELIRSTDATTADVSKFYVPDTDSEIGKTVALGRTLDYRFTLSPLPFSAQSTILPIAKVVVDSGGNVTGIVDARELMFRLGRGGDQPNQSGFTWPQARVEAYGGDAFAGGDKAITSLKDWMDAAMTRIQEIGGGPAWYSATADRNVTMIWTGATFANGENFEWDGTNLHWKGLSFIFDNTVGTINEIADQLGDSAGLTDLADGDVIYVDLDRTQNLTGGSALVAVKGQLATLGVGNNPGSRNVLAWRVGTAIYTRNWRYPVGTTFTPATTASLGVVQLNQTPGSVSNPVVVSIMADGRIEVQATGGTVAAITGRGGAPTGAWAYEQAGVLGYGANGVGGGTTAMKIGRQGVMGQGGTGIQGGFGGISLGGGGDAALDANAVGGGGHYAQGGAGVGTGLGGVAYSGMGGADGSGTYREPAFVATLPGSGPIPDVGFRSLAGSVEIPIADRYRFGADKTGFVTVHSSDFQPANGAAGAAATPPRFNPSVTTEGPFWSSLAAATTELCCRVPVPRGATLVAGYILGENTHAANSYNINVAIQSRVVNLGGTWTKSDVLAPNNHGFAPLTLGWGAMVAFNTVVAPDGTTDNGGCVTVDIILPQTAIDGNIRLRALCFKYVYQTVDFMV